MANRYWVGGTATWNGTAGTKWATTSGGAGGASVPGTGDNVFFDAASGSVTVTISSGNSLSLALNCTGFTGTFQGSALAASPAMIDFWGDVTLSAGLTLSGYVGFRFRAACNFTSAGQVIYFLAGQPGGTCTLQDDFVSVPPPVGGGFHGIQMLGGSLNANGFDILTWVLVNDTAGGTLSMGSGTITCEGIFRLNAGCSVVPGTSTLVLATGASAASFNGGNHTFYDIEFSRAAGLGYSILNSFSCNTLTVVNASTLVIAAGSVITASIWDLAAGMTIDGQTSTHTLSCPSGSVTVTAATIDNSIATGGATFTAINSTDGGGNTGWIFASVGNVNSLFFGSTF